MTPVVYSLLVNKSMESDPKIPSNNIKNNQTKKSPETETKERQSGSNTERRQKLPTKNEGQYFSDLNFFRQFVLTLWNQYSTDNKPIPKENEEEVWTQLENLVDQMLKIVGDFTPLNPGKK